MGQQGRHDPAEVLLRSTPTLAYTTIDDHQTRLLDKGLIERERQGRARTPTDPPSQKAELRASRMSDALAARQDRDAVLGRFVDTLSASEG